MADESTETTSSDARLMKRPHEDSVNNDNSSEAPHQTDNGDDGKQLNLQF